MTDFVRPDIVNYKSVAQHNGRYRLRKLPLTIGSSATMPLIAGSTVQAQFKIPARTIFNPARSILDFQLFFAGELAKASWTYEDTIPEIASIVLGNSSGVELVNLPYANTYLHSVRKLDTSKGEFEGNDYSSGLHKAKSILPADNNFLPTVAMPLINTFNELAVTLNHSFTTPDFQYSRTNATIPAGPAVATLTCPRSLALSAFKGTILAMDRDMIFADELYLTIQLASSTRVGFNTTTALDPTIGPTNVFAIQPAINNMYLNLAVQVDPAVEAFVRAGFESGKLSFIFPWVHTARNIGGAAGYQSVSITYPAQMGKKLKRIVHVPYDPTETLRLGFDHQNLDGVKISSYQTYMDSNPLQDNLISCRQPICDDFRENRQMLKGSALENSAIYYYNWLHVDSFSNPKRDADLPTDNVLEGLDMDRSRNWVFSGTTSANLLFYTFASFVRQVVCSPDMTVMLSQF